MDDDFRHHAASLTAPASAAETIMPDDDTDLSYVTRAIYVGQGGDLVVQLLSGDAVTLANVQAGVVYPIRAARVLATGTTAAFLVGMR